MIRRKPEEIDALVRGLAGVGLASAGPIHPRADQFRALLEGERGGPVEYLNLLAFRERARYPEGHALANEGLSGADAYGRYGEVAMRKIVERGGRIAAANQAEQLLIGAGPGWDQMVIVEYPDRAAFVDMLLDVEYQAASVHRDAGLERTLLLITRSLLPRS